MAELLIRVVDKVQPDPVKAERLLRAGDVVSVCPDGWPWTVIERTNSEWRIIRVNLLATTVEALIARSSNPLVRRRREWKLDFSLLPNPSLVSGARTQEIVPLTRQQVVAAVVKKAAEV
jgi:hypothetical protein